MIPSIDKMLDELVAREGGFAHISVDRGGATKYGITAATLAAWRGRPVSDSDVASLDIPEAKNIYLSRYYLTPGFGRLPAPLDILMFDFGVNSGPSLATRYLQEALGIPADGVCGPLTVAAAIASDLPALINRLCCRRCEMLVKIVKRDPSQLTFLTGWITRALSFVHPR